MTLQGEPWNLDLGDSVYVTVTASNLYGESLPSPVGNGATVVQIPDPPIQLQDDTSVTTASVIGITWIEGISHGGADVIDYRVWYD